MLNVIVQPNPVLLSISKLCALMQWWTSANSEIHEAFEAATSVTSKCHSVDGRNPAPFDMDNIPFFIGFYNVLYIPGGAGVLPSTVAGKLQKFWLLGKPNFLCGSSATPRRRNVDIEYWIRRSSASECLKKSTYSIPGGRIGKRKKKPHQSNGDVVLLPKIRDLHYDFHWNLRRHKKNPSDDLCGGQRITWMWVLKKIIWGFPKIMGFPPKSSIKK